MLRLAKRTARSYHSWFQKKDLVSAKFNMTFIYPIGRIKIKEEIIARDDCAEGTQFYKSYLDPKLLKQE